MYRCKASVNRYNAAAITSALADEPGYLVLKLSLAHAEILWYYHVKYKPRIDVRGDYPQVVDGQPLGAGDVKRAEVTAWRLMAAAVVSNIVMGLALALIPAAALGVTPAVIRQRLRRARTRLRQKMEEDGYEF